MPKAVSGIGLPGSVRVKLRYAQYFTLNSGVGTIASQAFRANSCFDPDYSGVGHQPMGFDQLAALYDHYTVLKSSIKLYAPDNFNESCATGIYLGDDATSYTDLPSMVEQYNSKVVYAVGMAKVWTVSHSYDAAKFFGIKDPTDNHDTIGARTNTNPTDGAYFVIFHGALTPSSDMGAATFWAVLEYDTIFTERAKVPAS
jgi:hypothetical protein